MRGVNPGRLGAPALASRAMRSVGRAEGRWLGLMLGLWVALPAQAQPYELRSNLWVDVPVTVGLGLGWGALEASKEELAPRACRWCEEDAAGRSTVNALDASARRALRWDEDHVVAARGSDLSAFVLAPLSAFGLNALAAQQAGVLENAPLDSLIVLESVAASMVLNQTAKFLFGRARPFVHALPPDERGRTQHPADNYASFYSGHSSLAFTLATASGTVASLRGYSWAPLVWGTGLTLATAAGYLRIAADRHYLTDVLVGALVGSAVGVAVPRLFHGRLEPEAGEMGQQRAGLRREAGPRLVLAWSW